MPLRAFRIAYDGAGYHGFQRQPDVATVEDALFDGLRELGVLAADADKPAGYAAAGRTDAGVSALAQTICLEAPEWLTPRAFNAGLPADIRAWAAVDAPPDFHATHDASERTYSYHLYAPSASNDHGGDDATDAGGHTALERECAVDDGRFRAACEALSGPHDFHNLTPDDRNTERAPTLEASRDGDYLVVTVTAGGFARELVRRLVSLARAVGTGTEPLAKIDRALAPEPLPGHEGVAPAPPEPLVLTDVTYPPLSFDPDPEAAVSAREVFRERRIDRRTGARVVGQIGDGIR
ncbi:tRNA pseudouridine(38-40) synthase TruA [Natronolimnohabitans innermongolicus]|uniref:tRNA pseudouridine synthase A n=1 Tax=Natronolimnohabitans innermongolicus JCM 12255 TaxID=1227499 RepID=L9WVZ0_9EURY|nr:tRNA pseudouridine(38-40) synthase TruA [Natronolimnohabitans innermongolicus]ELY53674.1 tRNA pseudouridine synthase A [Natronolimnohabitans innermongolicus JCM 12255]